MFAPMKDSYQSFLHMRLKSELTAPFTESEVVPLFRKGTWKRTAVLCSFHWQNALARWIIIRIVTNKL